MTVTPLQIDQLAQLARKHGLSMFVDEFCLDFLSGQSGFRGVAVMQRDSLKGIEKEIERGREFSWVIET